MSAFDVPLSEGFIARQIVEGSSAMIAALDLEYRFIAFNSSYRDEFRRIFGIEVENGVSFADALAGFPDDLHAAIELWRRALAGEEFTAISEFGDRARSRNIYEISFGRICDEEGNQIGASHIVRDVTSKIRAEEAARRLNRELERQAALRHSEQHFRHMTDSLPQLAWTADPDGRVDYYNARRREFEGLFHNGVRWKWDAIVHPEDAERTRTLWRQAFAHQCTYEVAHRLKRVEGAYRWYLSRAVPVRAPDGTIVKWYGTATDIDRQKQTELQLQAREEQLREADRRKDEFLAMLGHELRNPLAALSSGMDLWSALEPNVDNKLARVRSMMDRQRKQLARLIDDLLDVTRITRGKIQLEHQRLDLRSLVRDGAEGVRREAEAKGLSLRVSIAGNEMPVIGDPQRLEQVLSNLLSNSIRYTPAGGMIIVEARRDNNHARIVVRDTGIGLSSEALAQVFVPFWQADRSIERSHGGLGLGLALVCNLVELHGGEVNAHSEGPGKGCEFTVSLPLADTARAGMGGEPAAESEPAGSKVLIVYDNLDLAETMAELLEARGYQTHQAHEGEEALERAYEFEPDVVLLDIGLPKLDGYEVATRLREELDAETPTLIAVTGYGSEDDRERAREAGFDGHLTKPVASDDLVELIEELRSRRPRASRQQPSGRPSTP